jgi:exonuclease SbcC
VLNLAQYERYAARARDLAKAEQRTVDQLSGRLSELAAELARQQAYEEAVQQAEIEERQTRLARSEADAARAEAQQILRELENKEQNRVKLARRVERARLDHQQTGDELEKARQRLSQLEALVAQKDALAQRYQRWQQAEEELSRCDQVLAQLRPLEQQAYALQQAIAREQAKLEQDLALRTQALSVAEKAAAALPEWSQQAETLRAQVVELEALEAESRRRTERLLALQSEMKDLQTELAHLEKLLAALPDLKLKQTALQQEVAALETLEQENRERAQRLSELRVMIQQARDELSRLRQEADELKERRAMLERGETDACPVCRRPLGEEGRQHVLQEYEQTLTTLRERYRQVQASMKTMTDEVESLNTAAKQATSELRRLPGLRSQLAALQARLDDYDGDEDALAGEIASLRQQLETLQQEQARLQEEQKQATVRLGSLTELRRELATLESKLAEAVRQEASLAGLRETVEALQARLAAGALPDQQAELVAVQEQLARLAYDAGAHSQARKLAEQLQDASQQWLRLQDAEARLPEMAGTVKRLEARWQREAEILQEDENDLAALTEAVQALPQARETWEQAQQAADEAHERWERAHGQLAAARQKLAALDGVRQQRDQLEDEIAAATAQMNRYAMLARAFGRDGMQAMIIEAALPELEAEANRLLARLSDGRMNVRLLTQREKKTGGVREALDIIISDELGSRSYELYSGGEAFRVDLALRIALSRLLARRAGAALQTLFIDEGFGTQDAQGRENLVEAIHMIKDEFALILVITHIDELKDQFPVRILIEKNSDGSFYRIS